MSAYGEGFATRSLAGRGDSDAFVAKPVRFDQLLPVLTRLLAEA